MEKIKSQIIIIVIVTIVSTVLLCVVPQGKLRSAFKILCALVIVYSIIAPFASFDFDSLDFDSLFEKEEQRELYSNQSNDAALMAANEGFERAAEGLLKENGYEIESIEAECAIEEDEVILKRLTIYGPFKSDEQSKLSEILRQITGENTEIVYVNGEET